jgi:soluble lytic murein transglycosylase-like protein
MALGGVTGGLALGGRLAKLDSARRSRDRIIEERRLASLPSGGGGFAPPPAPVAAPPIRPMPRAPIPQASPADASPLQVQEAMEALAAPGPLAPSLPARSRQRSSDPARAKYEGIAFRAEDQYKIPQGGLLALIGAESNWNPNAKSSAGAEGIAQFMPPTSAERGVDPYDPESAIPGAAAYLRWLKSQTGSWSSALAAYNWGIGRVKKIQREDGSIDPDRLPEETREYVKKLAGFFGETPFAPAASSPTATALDRLGKRS